ncbi:hypothetical protein D3C85_1055710 [compost metagenome]
MEKAKVYKADDLLPSSNVVAEDAYNKLSQAYLDLKAYNEHLEEVVIELKNKLNLQGTFKEFVNDL